MDKTADTELYRLYLIEQLPAPLTPASRHLQIFDNYIENTRLRLRKIRDPYSRSWSRMLQQRLAVDGGITRLGEIHLNDSEYAAFERFEGREIRKNRYFHEFDGAMVTFDVYLGELRGLNTVRVDFATVEEIEAFEAAPFMIFDVTRNELFSWERLPDAKLSDFRSEVARLERQNQPA